jgi:phytoene dehydrogenase-like protein
VIIGAGHNGLVAAAYLAEAGLRVLVLERRHLVGGAAVTEELHPGFRFSRASYVLSLFRPEIAEHLELARHGLSLLPRDPSSFTPLPDGRSLLLGPDGASNEREIAKFSTRDARRFGEYEAMLERVAHRVEPLLDWTPPALTNRRPADGARLARMAWWAARLGRDAPDVVQLLLGSARTLLDRWFESDVLKATLGTDAIIGAMASPRGAGTAYVLLHHVMGETGGRRGVWAYVRGGMGALSEAIAAAARERGVTIRTEMPVGRIVVEGGRAVGVELEHGKEIGARAVLSNADPITTFLRLTPTEALPGEFRDRVAAIDVASPSVKINVALSELPDFRACPGSTASPHHRGTIHISPSLDYIEEAYADAHAGRTSASPVLEITLPSALDDTLAPPGCHVMSMFVQYGPYTLTGTTWEAERERFGDRCLEILAEYAPNVARSVLFREVLAPPDQERIFGITGGNIFHGAMTQDQLFSMRPVPGYADYRTPVRDLYLCGAGTHPGGGVLGACGRNAAREVLRDHARR